MIPPKLEEGDHVRVIAPAHGFSPDFTQKYRERATDGFARLGLTVSYGKYVDELNEFKTATVDHRLEDIHEAFADPRVQAIIPARGGSTSNQLLKHLDYDLIRKNPKILCGLSDITALSYAIYTKTGLVNYYGPHFTTLGASKIVDYSFDMMKKSFFSKTMVDLYPSEHYCNSDWEREVIVNDGFWTINEGEAEGACIGGNLLTTSYTIGSEYMPDIRNKILFFEENKVIDFRGVQTELQALLNQPDADKIRGLIIGRFQRETQMTRELLTKMVKDKTELQDVPVIANVDFGHTVPVTTLPIGGAMRMSAKEGDKVSIKITDH